MLPSFQTYQLAYQAMKGKAHELDSNVNAEAKECDRDANSRRRLRYFYRGIEKRASFLLVLVGAPRKESLARAKLPVR